MRPAGRTKEKGSTLLANPLRFLAGSTGLEPVASGVTGWRYNRLNYDPDLQGAKKGPFVPPTAGLPSPFVIAPLKKSSKQVDGRRNMI